MIHYLVEITGANLANGIEQKFYYTNATSYVSSESDTPANTIYLPRVLQPGNIKLAMFQDGKTGGASSVGYGDISLANKDGMLDSLLQYSFNGRSIVVKEVTDAGQSVIFTGTLEQPLFTMDTVSLMIRDRQIILDQALLTNLYAGNNVLPDGVEGVDDIKGKPKPRVYGTVANITPVLVNTAKLTYQVSDKSVYSIVVYDNGVNITAGADCVDVAALQAAIVAPGTFQTCKAAGIFRLGSSPAGQITADVAATDGYEVVTDYFLVDAAKWIFQLSDFKLSDVQVTSAGGFVQRGLDYSTYLALANAPAPANGSFLLCLELGLVRVPVNMPQPWVFKIKQVNMEPGITTAQIAVEILNDSGLGIPINNASVSAVASACPWSAGLFVNGTESIASLLDQAAESSAAWYSFDAFGAFTFHRLSFSIAGSVKLNITPDNIFSAERVATQDTGRGVPAWRHVVNYNKNYTVQDQIAGAVPPTRTAWLKEEYRTVVNENPSVKALHLLSPQREYTTCLNTANGAGDVAANRLSLLGVMRDRLTVSLPLKGLAYPTIGVWDADVENNLYMAVHSSTSVMVGNYLYVIGGRLRGGYTVAGCWRKDMSATHKQWEPISPLPEPREQSAAVVYNGIIYLLGGYGLQRGIISRFAQTLLYDTAHPENGWYTNAALDLPYQLYGHTAVLLLNPSVGACIYVAGGVPYTGSQVSASVLFYIMDNSFPGWQDATPMPAAVANHCAAKINDTYFIVCGGRNNSGIGYNTAYIVDGTTSALVWNALPNMPAQRFACGCVIMGNILYVVGGVSYSNILNKNVWMLDVNTPIAWDALSAAPLPQSLASMVVAACGGELFVAGGYTVTITESTTLRFRTNNNPDDRAALYEIGQPVMVTLPRYGYAYGGKQMIIIGSEVDYEAGIINLDLWG